MKRAIGKAAPKGAKSATTTRAPRAKAVAFDLGSRLAALPPESAAAAPGLPIKVALLEAERLHGAALKLRPKLGRLPGFSVADLDGLPVLIAALGRAELAWQGARAERAAASTKGVRREAEALRRGVMVAGRFLLRRDPAAQRDLDLIAEGEGLADLVHDLDALAGLVERHRATFALDERLPKDSPARLRHLAAQLKRGVDSSAALDAQGERNRLASLLERTVAEVRSAARFLLADDPKRLVPVLSQYEALRKRRQRAAKAAGPGAEGPK